MGNTTQNRYKRMLLAKRWELLSTNGGRLLTGTGGGPAEADDLNPAPAEGEAMFDSHPSLAWSNLWRAIGWALVRLDEGNFGYCTSCGKLITSAHLDTTPWTDCCLDCMRLAAACY